MVNCNYETDRQDHCGKSHDLGFKYVSNENNVKYLKAVVAFTNVMDGRIF